MWWFYFLKTCKGWHTPVFDRLGHKYWIEFVAAVLCEKMWRLTYIRLWWSHNQCSGCSLSVFYHLYNVIMCDELHLAVGWCGFCYRVEYSAMTCFCFLWMTSLSPRVRLSFKSQRLFVVLQLKIYHCWMFMTRDVNLPWRGQILNLHGNICT